MRTKLLAAIVLLLTNIPPVSADVTSAERTMVLVQTINGAITPKSVRASGTGFVSAHNMMYRHSITIYDADSMELVATIPDTISPSSFGITGYSGSYRGAPVEGAYSPDGRYLYVTNYAMYGKGLMREGTDICKPADNYDRSFLYRIDTSSWKIDSIYKVGTVPKVVAVSPDNKYVLVTNWCSYDLYVISVASQKVIKTLKIGAYPRGIVISKDSQFAFVAQMGGDVVHKITLGNWSDELLKVGHNPRALVLSPDNAILYATLNLSGKVIAYDLIQKKVIKSVKTGDATRSLDISTDGTALFVVNFNSGTVSKVRTSDFSILQTLKVCEQPIGVTYEPLHQRTWVACYLGQIKIFNDSLKQ